MIENFITIQLRIKADDVKSVVVTFYFSYYKSLLFIA